MKNVALILAGGIGKRMNTDIPKQFIMVNSKPLIIHTLKIFDNMSVIDELYIVCLNKYRDLLKKYIEEYNIKKKIFITKSGTNGFFSTLNGIKTIKENIGETDLNVIIHDANRPFVKEEEIIDSINTCNNYGNAISAIQSTEIIMYSEDGKASDTSYKRENLYRVQKPECYRLYDLLKIYAEAIDKGLTNVVATCDLLTELNQRVYFSLGNPENIK